MTENKKTASFGEKNCFEFICQVSKKEFDNNKYRYNNNGSFILFLLKAKICFLP